jgi:adenosylcobinamide kinase/adenosylcobinamide-phosphate guanylyltransferase
VRTLVTGGARSGKSTFAESVMGGGQVDYVATGYPASAEDPDWADRVRSHQVRRPAGWHTTETLDVAGVLLADSPTPVLVDCVGLWLTRTADELNAWAEGAEDAVEARVSGLLDALSRTTRDVVLVTNEVGLGLVPDTASGRWFRDALGRLNIGLAGRCDEVWLCVAGIPVPVKHG